MKLIECKSVRTQRIYAYENWDERVELSFFLGQHLLEPDLLKLALTIGRLKCDKESIPKYYRFPNYANRLKKLIKLVVR